MTWFGCIDTLRNWLGQPLYHGSYPGIWCWNIHHFILPRNCPHSNGAPIFGSPLPAQITTRPVPFKPRSDKDPLVADLQSECSCGCANWSWTMDNGPKKHFTSGQHPKTTGKLWALVLKSCLGHLPRHQAPESHMWYMPNRMSDRMSEYIYIYILYIYIYTYRIYTSRWYVKIMCQGGNHSKKVMKFLASLPAGRVDSFCAENSMKVAFKHCGKLQPSNKSSIITAEVGAAVCFSLALK